ncbi:MAG: glutamine synthetase [Candidatus Moduliflexus flocculans]|nr:glutamine synthetase [Candidatus Moduliflexus flocculans]
MRGADGKLSVEARKLIGGLCEYADSLTAFGNTVSSAYLRLVPNQEAPTRICWSDLNRSALIRVPLGWTDAGNLSRKVNPADTADFTDERGGRQTVEIRSPDGSAMIHLTLAGHRHGRQLGLQGRPGPVQGLRPARARRRSLRQGQHLRRQGARSSGCPSCRRAASSRAGSCSRSGPTTSATASSRPSVIDYVAGMLQAENDEFMNKKLTDLPAHDRLHEIRKIMHKDLHKN